MTCRLHVVYCIGHLIMTVACLYKSSGVCCRCHEQHCIMGCFWRKPALPTVLSLDMVQGEWSEAQKHFKHLLGRGSHVRAPIVTINTIMAAYMKQGMFDQVRFPEASSTPLMSCCHGCHWSQAVTCSLHAESGYSKQTCSYCRVTAQCLPLHIHGQ